MLVMISTTPSASSIVYNSERADATGRRAVRSLYRTLALGDAVGLSGASLMTQTMALL